MPQYDLSEPYIGYRSAGRRPEANNDRTAAANAPLSALRGWAAGTLGLPGDIEGLARAGISQLPPQVLTAFPALRAFGIGSRADPTPQLPTTEFYNEYLPGAQLNETPTGKAFTTAGNLFGGSGTTTLARYGIKSAKATAKAIAEAAPGPASGSRAAQLGVIKMPGGNFLKGSVEEFVSQIKRRETPSIATSQEEADDLIARGFVRDKAGGDGYYLPFDPVNNFIDKQLTRYIKNDMATPGDPLRAMAEKYAVDKPVKLAEVQGRIDAFAAKMEQTARERGVPVGDLTSMRQQMIGLEKEKALVEARQALHTYNPEDALYNEWLVEQTASARKRAGFPEQGLGVSPAARAWENASDLALNASTASEHTRLLSASQIRQGLGSTVDTNSWLLKVPPETPVYYPKKYLSEDLGFNHLVDELRNATNPESGLPKNLLIDQADLSKLTMAQAVDRVADINAWRATQKAKADLLRANNAATQLVKEYPGQGMKWVELKAPKDKPLVEGEYADPLFDIPPNQQERIMDQAHQRAARQGLDEEGDDYRMVVEGYAQELATKWAKRNKPKVSKELEDALKYEGDTMAHCVGGYCQDVLEGRSRIYSLRDDKGQPRVTIEVKPQNTQGYYNNMPPDDRTKLLNNAMEYYAQAHPEVRSLRHPAQRIDMIEEYLASQGITPPERIIQIKGFNNKKPADEFLPFVQDFVKSGNWSKVNELENAGLKVYQGDGGVKYVTPEEYNIELQKELGLLPLKEGMAHGGIVHMAGGGKLVKGLMGVINKAGKAADAVTTTPKVEAPSIIIPSKVSNVKEAVRQSKGDYGARRVERAADEIPNLERLYKEEALKRVFEGDNAKAMMTLNPSRFEEFATPIGSTFTRPNSVRRTSTGEQVTFPEYLEHLRTVGGFDDVPFLEINKQRQGTEATPFISNHEGRHRNRAMAQSGETSGLVQLLPRAELREPFPRRSQEDYIEALRKELEMTGNIVLPQWNQYQPNLPQRRAINLPDIYAEGGEVHMAHGGIVSSNHFDPIKIKQIIADLDDEYDPENIQQIIAQRESAYA